MSVRTNSEEIRKIAFDNTVREIRSQRSLPENVFFSAWNCFRFIQSDWMFSASFADTARDFLEAEAATVICLLNLTRSVSLEFDAAATMYLDETIQGDSYKAAIRGDDTNIGWIHTRDTYACASDIGEWCIYCETVNDVGVVALKEPEDLTRFRTPLARLRSGSLETLCDPKVGQFPFTELVPHWRDGFAKNFKNCG